MRDTAKDKAASAMLAALKDWLLLVSNSSGSADGNRAFVDPRDMQAFAARTRAAIATAEAAGIKVEDK